MSNQWDDWDDWEDWQDWGEPNRYGFYGLNCKNRPSGTGTTHSNRREARRNLQWDNLTKAVPDTEETLASQAAALEKAAEKAKKKLEEMKKKREEEEVNYRGKKTSRGPSPPKKLLWKRQQEVLWKKQKVMSQLWKRLRLRAQSEGEGGPSMAKRNCLWKRRRRRNSPREWF